ncbi:MAG: DUF2336 domain-containing protein [Rhodoblastus sp.]|nr:MAG: DUF2336 domain-containing protein [Rhodoblastus sp.]
MASGLADHADPVICAEAARLLVDHPCAPTRLLEKLARLSPQAAVVVLGSARPVSPARLAAAAAWGAPELAAAVAARADLDGPIAAALAARVEREVALALARNLSAPLTRADLRLLIARARDDAELAEALLPRAEGDDAAPLFLHAGARLRMEILAAAMRRDLAAGIRATPCLLDDDGFEALLAAAARKDRDQTAASLGEALDIPAVAARRLLGDASGEGAALALAALGLDDQRRDLLLMFLAPGDGASVAPYERLSRLAGATPTRTARRLIEALVSGPSSVAASGRRACGADAALSARAVAGEQPARARSATGQPPASRRA